MVITAADRRAFKRCRRAWDFGSPLRQGWEPDVELVEVDLGAAVRAALAVWYFPGMWEWGRSIVRPLAIEAYRGVVSGWPAGYSGVAGQGEKLLGRYFDWAPAVDLFTPVRVETDVEVSVPDPADPRRDLAGGDGAAVHYSDRVDLVVIDAFNTYWLVDHRIGDDWVAPDALALDEAGAASCWAWSRSYLGMDIAGVIYNELRTGNKGDAETFRRTPIRRGLAELERARHKLGCEARDMTSAGLAVYPAPAWDVCSACQYRPPCIALDTGADAEAVLATGYRRRPPAVPQEGRLGGATWSMGRGAAPPRFGSGSHPGR